MHGRVFQSVFSQCGANVRSNPPNAAARPVSTRSRHPQFVGSVARLRVRAGSADRAPRSRCPIRSGDAVHASMEPLRTSASCPSTRRCGSTTTATTASALLKYALDNLPHVAARRSRHRGRSSEQRAGAPASRICAARRSIAIAADVDARGPDCPDIPVNAACPNAVPIADNEISLRVPRTNERRARSALHDQSGDQQRRRDRGTTACRSSGSSASGRASSCTRATPAASRWTRRPK